MNKGEVKLTGPAKENLAGPSEKKNIPHGKIGKRSRKKLKKG